MASEVSAQTQYRQEFVMRYEQRMSLLRGMATTEAVIKGNTARFLVTGRSGNMQDRGVNGLIVGQRIGDTPVDVILRERHYLEHETSFDIFTGQGDRRRLIQDRAMFAANGEVDDVIINALNAATNTFDLTGTGPTVAEADVRSVVADLREEWVGLGVGSICFLWTPKAWAHLQGNEEFSSADYVNQKQLVSEVMNDDAPRAVRWLQAYHMEHPGLPGVGTATATCIVFHKAAIGHAMAVGDIMTRIGYNDEHDYSYARATIFHEAKVLQQEGIYKMTHNDTTAVT